MLTIGQYATSTTHMQISSNFESAYCTKCTQLWASSYINLFICYIFKTSIDKGLILSNKKM